MNYHLARYNFWDSSDKVELTVRSMTGGAEDLTLIQIREAQNHQWTIAVVE